MAATRVTIYFSAFFKNRVARFFFFFFFGAGPSKETTVLKVILMVLAYSRSDHATLP